MTEVVGPGQTKTLSGAISSANIVVAGGATLNVDPTYVAQDLNILDVGGTVNINDFILGPGTINIEAGTLHLANPGVLGEHDGRSSEILFLHDSGNADITVSNLNGIPPANVGMSFTEGLLDIGFDTTQPGVPAAGVINAYTYGGGTAGWQGSFTSDGTFNISYLGHMLAG
jgi:hypothetical protein